MDKVKSSLKRKFAVSAWVWTADFDKNGKECVTKASEMGFDGIEIPTLTGNLDMASIVDSLRSTELEPIIIGGGSQEMNISSPDPATNKRGIEYVKKCIEFCDELGGSLVCGPLHAAVGNLEYLLPKERDRSYTRISKSSKELGKFASDRGIRIALEPLCRYDTQLVNTAADAVKLARMIDTENVGILLDTFHMNIEEKSFESAINLVADKLFHFHACENDRGTPGSGLLRWDEVAASLRRADYKGWIAIESFTPFERNFSTAMRVWRKLAQNQDEIAEKGLAFLKSKFS